MVFFVVTQEIDKKLAIHSDEIIYDHATMGGASSSSIHPHYIVVRVRCGSICLKATEKTSTKPIYDSSGPIPAAEMGWDGDDPMDDVSSILITKEK